MEANSNVSLPAEPRFRCGNTCLRGCLVTNSIILWVEGAVFLLLGVFAYNFRVRFFTDEEDLKYTVTYPIAAISFGIVTVLIYFIINYVLIFPSKIRYYAISITLALMVLFQFYFITTVIYGSKVERMVIEGFEKAMVNYKDGHAFNMELHLIQWLLQCCGVKNYKDWFQTSWADGRLEVPESCCINVKECHNLDPVMVDDIYEKGCEKKLAKFIKFHSTVIIMVIIFSILTQIIAVILSLILGKREVNKIESPKMTSTGLLLPDSRRN